MRREIDWSALEYAFLHGSWACRFYFDTQSGAVLSVTEHVRRQLDVVYADVGEENAPKVLDSAEMLQAHQVEMDDRRFLHVLPAIEAQQREWCDAFALTCDEPLRRLLWSALDRGNVAHFERTLLMEPVVNEAWQRFRLEQIKYLLTQQLSLEQ